jgi:hypothetical protein
MSGLGIQYPPPTEDVPIFDPLLFLEAVSITTSGGGGGSYLNFPFAQGKETMADMDVTGLGQFFSGITLNGALGENLTNNQNIIMNGATSTYIQFPDGTRQSTAPIGLTPSGVTAGAYTNTNLTVNANGIITLASNGIVPIPATPVVTAGTTNFTANGAVTYNQYGQITSATSGVIPAFAGGTFTIPSSITVNTYGQVTAITSGTAGSNVISTQIFTVSSNITFPAGTQFATIMISGAGGASGLSYNIPNEATTAGGGGGAGGCMIYNRLPMEASTSMNCVITNGNTTLNYIPIPNTTYSNVTTEIGTVYAGQAGTSATAGGGNNPAGGAGGAISQKLFYPSGLAGGTGGNGQSIGAGTYLVPRGVNYLSQWNQNLQISATVNPFNYGIGGYSRINNALSGDVSIQPAGSACCLVISYSS